MRNKRKSFSVTLALLVLGLSVGFTSCGKLSDSDTKGGDIGWEDSPYVTVDVAFRDMYDNERMQAVEEAFKIVVDKLHEAIPANTVSEETLSELKEKSPMLGETFKKAEDWMKTSSYYLEKAGIGGGATAAIPSALLVHWGGKASINGGIGAGVAGSFILVIVPRLSKKVHKITKEVSEWHWQFPFDLVFVPQADVGLGAGGGGKFNFGFGAAFGELNKPEEFAGWTFGVSAAIEALSGLGLNGGVLRRTVNDNVTVYNPFILGTWTIGATVGFETHAAIGRVYSVSHLINQIDSFKSAMMEGSKTTEEGY